ncbi:MAG TPA: peptide ABC transporter substrate-binding protein [Anaerolinea sp.]|nr:peptide ABC transporter substrate-binding protein [Anaerolinea sp.]
MLIIFLTGMVVGVLLLSEKSQPTSPQATPVPVRGGVYTEALVGALQRLNPLLVSENAADRDVSRLIFSGLVRFDGRGYALPDLAEWGISADGTLYNVTLREGLKWHDGQPLTTDDVLFTIDLMRNGGDFIPTDLQEFWKGVDVVRLSDRAMQFQLPEAFAPFLDYLTFGVLPKHLLDGKTIDQVADDPFNLQPVGSGPFKFSRLIVENDQITGVVLAENPDYYLDKPYLSEIVFHYYADAPSAMQAYRDGQVQGIGRVDREILPDVLAESNLALYTVRQPKLSLVLFNLANPETAFLQDKKVRRALLMGLNRQGMIDQQLQGQAIQANGPILPGTWAYYDKLSVVAFDREAGKALLKEAGYSLASDQDTILSKEGKYLRFKLVYPEDDQHRAVAEAIQAAWGQMGVDVSIEGLPYDQLVLDRLTPRAYEAALVDLNLSRSPGPDPYPFWDQAQATGAGQNYTQWDNRMASEYLEEARINPDTNERARLYRNFQVVFNEELPALPLYFSVYNYAIDKEIQGVRVGPLFDSSDRFANITQWNLIAVPQRNQPPGATPTTP